jgi:hypothetical protein
MRDGWDLFQWEPTLRLRLVTFSIRDGTMGKSVRDE